MIPVNFNLEHFYALSQTRGMGNNIWYDNLEEILKAILNMDKQIQKNIETIEAIENW